MMNLVVLQTETVANPNNFKMNKIKSLWTTITGSLSSIIPLFFTVCKSGACGAVCVSPSASLLGISSAGLIASPLMQSLVPLLLVISAVSFTVSYYRIYVLPKQLTSCDADCACDTPKKSNQEKFAVWTFWIGLIASIIFFTYFEVQNYQANSTAKQTTEVEKCATNSNTVNTVSDTTKTATPCCKSDTKCEE